MRICYEISVLLITTALITSGCSSAQFERLENVGKMPPLQKTDDPTASLDYKPMSWPMPPTAKFQEVRTANSLWSVDSRSFFKDLRARSVGDIVLVTVDIQDKAELDNKTERSRNASENVPIPSIYGLQKKIKGVLPESTESDDLLNIESTTDTTGEGKIDREEKIQTQIAAVVVQVLPNGNMVIKGTQEIRVNFEVRQVTVEGVIRPQDISPDNTIRSSQVAEARISYGGRGHITDVQQPRIGQQVFDVLSPF